MESARKRFQEVAGIPVRGLVRETILEELGEGGSCTKYKYA
jgi:hypothetical protein